MKSVTCEVLIQDSQNSPLLSCALASYQNIKKRISCPDETEKDPRDMLFPVTNTEITAVWFRQELLTALLDLYPHMTHIARIAK